MTPVTKKPEGVGVPTAIVLEGVTEPFFWSNAKDYNDTATEASDKPTYTVYSPAKSSSFLMELREYDSSYKQRSFLAGVWSPFGSEVFLPSRLVMRRRWSPPDTAPLMSTRPTAKPIK
jgi:hypothetical protein